MNSFVRPSAIDVAWAAGFYEGKGHMVCTENQAGRGLTLSISQVNIEPLARFAAIFPGGFMRLDRNRNHPIHVYRLHNATAQRVAMVMWPLLSRRRQTQILQAIWKYVLRRIRNPLRCRRGHLYAESGQYRTECCVCRAARRRGQQESLPPLPRAIDLRIGVREYRPGRLRVPPDIRTAHAAVAWTFDETPESYAPAIQT